MKKNIYNSLGSNYNFHFVMSALRQLVAPNKDALEILRQQLQNQYGGQVILTYKGRDAIEYGLRLAKIGQGAEVLTQAFTCHAIEEAIVRSGAEPVFVDIEYQTFNPSLKLLKAAYEKHPKVKAVIIQHTLGIPAEIKKIKSWCEKNKLILIEDIASAVGGTDASGVSLGTYGDLVVLSFGRDKMIDAVSGGALIINKDSLQKRKDAMPSLSQVSRFQITKDLLYPLTTWKIRTFQFAGIGSFIFWTSKLLGLLSSPIKSPFQYMTSLPASHAALVLVQQAKLDQDLAHRRQVANVYLEKLGKEFRTLITTKTLAHSSNIRFSFMVHQPDLLAKALRKYGIYITDRWYRRAVDCGQLKYRSLYQQGSCPYAEELARKIINLPTHRHVTIEDARNISKIIKKVYAELQR